MPDITFQIDENDKRRLQEKLDSVSLIKRPVAMLRAFKNVGLLVEKRLKANVSGRHLNRRTGMLAKSISSKIDAEGSSLVARVGSGVLFGKRARYASILETGGTITPTRSQYLTVPLPLALTRAGVMKHTSPRDFANTFVRRSNAGNLIIFQKTGKKKIEPLFVLKKEVHIPAKRYMSETLRQMQSRVIQIMLASINRELEKK